MSEPQSKGNAFEDVDRSDDPAGRVRYLDAVRAQGRVGEQKRMTLEMMHLNEGDAGLDVGCGTGDDVIAIARIVGPKGYAAGVDMSETMIEEARKRAAAEGVQADFRCTDGATLPFADATFHAARIERVLIHVESPDRGAGRDDARDAARRTHRRAGAGLRRVLAGFSSPGYPPQAGRLDRGRAHS